MNNEELRICMDLLAHYREMLEFSTDGDKYYVKRIMEVESYIERRLNEQFGLELGKAQ